MEMLSYKRPMGSPSEKEFIRRYIDVLPHVTCDRQGNRHLIIGEEPVVLWSAHTDTVHGAKGRQSIREHKGILSLAKPQQGDCLGADNGAGVFLLLSLIEAKVPGHYIFHRGEERGCIGSSFIARETPDVLVGLKYAIAFDRKGTNEVITHQCGMRTASDAFALSLSAMLGMEHKPSRLGIYTDTNEYSALIPECTNVSVGYEMAHGPNEVLNLKYLLQLRDALLENFSQEKLVCERDCRLEEFDYDDDLLSRGRDYRTYSAGDRWWQQNDMDSLIAEYPEAVKLLLIDLGVEPRFIASMMDRPPERISQILTEAGVTFDELEDYCVGQGIGLDWDVDNSKEDFPPRMAELDEEDDEDAEGNH